MLQVSLILTPHECILCGKETSIQISDKSLHYCFLSHSTRGVHTLSIHFYRLLLYIVGYIVNNVIRFLMIKIQFIIMLQWLTLLWGWHWKVRLHPVIFRYKGHNFFSLFCRCHFSPLVIWEHGVHKFRHNAIWIWPLWWLFAIKWSLIKL